MRLNIILKNGLHEYLPLSTYVITDRNFLFIMWNCVIQKCYKKR